MADKKNMSDEKKEEILTQIPENVEAPVETEATQIPENVEAPVETEATQIPENVEAPVETEATQIPENVEAPVKTKLTVRIAVPALNIRALPDATAEVVGCIVNSKETHKIALITETADGNEWGKLADDSGWINLAFVTDVLF